MRIRSTTDVMVVKDAPGCIWLLALMFVVGGTVALAAAAGLVDGDGGPISAWARLAAFMLGAAHLGGALWIFRGHAATETVMDRAQGLVVVRTSGVGPGREDALRFRNVAGVEVREEKDGDGDPVYTLTLRLKDGRALPLHSLPQHGRDALDADARAIRTFLRLPDSSPPA
jgi:hypothetical protein